MQANYYMKNLYQDMQLCGYTGHTQEVYGRVAGKFLNYSGKSIEALDEHDVRNYILHLMNRSLSKSSINTYQAAIRFFFGVTLNRSMNYLQTPRVKEDQTFPEILSREKMARLLERCKISKHRAMFALAYGSGLRVSESCAFGYRILTRSKCVSSFTAVKGIRIVTQFSPGNALDVYRITGVTSGPIILTACSFQTVKTYLISQTEP